jgi:hypothetical protein
MASLVKKKKGNRLYYYLVESARVDGKPRIVHQAYLGTAEKLAELVQHRSAPIPSLPPYEISVFPAPCGWLPNSAACGPYWNPAAKLRVDIANSIVVGESVWDLLAARRARALGVGVLSGGYEQDELERAGAYRVYQNPSSVEASGRTPA